MSKQLPLSITHNPFRIQGYLYLAENPVWPGWLKLGSSCDLQRRLGAFQTSDPFRAYRISAYIFLDLPLDKVAIKTLVGAEKIIHSIISRSFPTKGEWIKGNRRKILKETDLIEIIYEDEIFTWKFLNKIIT
jgi:hypothetical protein